MNGKKLKEKKKEKKNSEIRNLLKCILFVCCAIKGDIRIT